MAPIVTGSMRPKSAALPREESAVVARSPVTYVCKGSESLALSWEMMLRMVTTFFSIGSVSADPNEPGAWEKVTRLIIAFLFGPMKFWASADWDVPEWPPLVLEVVTWESCRDNGKLAAKSRIQKTIISLYLLPTKEPIFANVGTRGPGDFGIPSLLETMYPAPPAT